MPDVQPPTADCTADSSQPDPFLYEWVLETANDSGISMTPHGAMSALAGSLEALGAGSGFIRPVVLREEIGKGWGYERSFAVSHRATCQDGGVSWH